MQPTRDIVLIQADKPKDKTESGLYIQEDWKTLPPTGEVLAVGPEVKTVKPGDKVVFERYGAIKYKDDQRLCKEAHIMGIINDTETTG